jgi:hypothetical protein
MNAVARCQCVAAEPTEQYPQWVMNVISAMSSHVRVALHSDQTPDMDEVR